MKVIVNLSEISSNAELLQAVTGPARITAEDLDQLYEALKNSSSELNYVFVHKSGMPEELSVYFAMLSMTIEEVSEIRHDLRVSTYYYDEEVN